MDDNHALSKWNDFWCAKVPEEKLQKVMGAGKENLWADSIWSIRAWRYWDIRNSSQHYWKTSETAMGCTSAAFTYQKYMKTCDRWAERAEFTSQWVNESSKDFCFSQPRPAAELAPCGRASRRLSAIGGSWELNALNTFFFEKRKTRWHRRKFQATSHDETRQIQAKILWVLGLRLVDVENHQVALHLFRFW